jgi:glucokinase
MQEHLANIATNDVEFLLCTNSGNSGVDCGVFVVKNNIPTLVLSTYIKNEDINNFTATIGYVLSCLKEHHGIAVKYACFAGPGVPSAGRDYLSHMRLPYVIDAKEIITAYQLADAIIVNDFLAMSYGINFLDKSKITTLYDAPAEMHGRRVIIGAGNGLGSVSMIWDDHKNAYISLPAEAGTGNFPAFDQFEFDLMMAMKKVRNFSTFHWAFFVSLPAIEYMHQILQDMNYQNCSTEKKYLDGMAILACAQSDACCNKATDLFYKFYARFVYNFVWNTLPFGGIYLVGETATTYPEMLSTIFLPEYFNCVESKRPLLQRIPIYVIKDDVSVGLYGVAQYFLLEKKDIFGERSFCRNFESKN